MQDMAHSIYLIKLYQMTMRKNFDFLFLTTLLAIDSQVPEFDYRDVRLYEE